MSFYRISLFTVSCFVLLVSNTFAHHPGAYTPVAGETDKSEESISAVPMLNSLSATTLGKHNTTAGFFFNHVNYDQIPVNEAHELHEEGRDIHGKKHEEFYNLHAGFGVTEDVDLFLITPIVSKASNQIEDHDALGRNERATGFGDMRLIGKYRFWKRGVEAAVSAGIKFPTGRTSDKDHSGAKFDPEQQPGSGSWDGEFGLAVSRSFKKRFSVSSDFQYFLRTEGGQQYEGGDIFRHDLGMAVSLFPLGSHPNAHFYVELNNEWARRDYHRGRKNPDSGGTTISITPGVSLSLTKNISAFWAMPVPIYQNLGGSHEEVEYQILTGVTISV